MRQKYFMNTSARMVAGLVLAVTGFIASFLTIPDQFMNGGALWKLPALGALCFFIVGWNGVGRNPRFGGIESVFAGMRSSLTAVVVAAFVFSLTFMMSELWEFEYLDPFEWAQDLIQNWFEYMFMTVNPPALFVLAIGGAAAGRLAGAANWHWR